MKFAAAPRKESSVHSKVVSWARMNCRGWPQKFELELAQGCLSNQICRYETSPRYTVRRLVRGVRSLDLEFVQWPCRALGPYMGQS